MDRKRLSERRRLAIEIGKSHREGKVYELLAAGLSVPEISSMLGLRESTVEVLKNIFGIEVESVVS